MSIKTYFRLPCHATRKNYIKISVWRMLLSFVAKNKTIKPTCWTIEKENNSMEDILTKLKNVSQFPKA